MTMSQRSPAEVKAEWQKRRIRRWIGAGIFITICLLLLISQAVLLAVFRSLAVFRKLPLFSIMPGLLVVFFGFLWWNNRCPACGKNPGGPAWEIKRCQHCGAQLKD
jgi:hypothetical protein